MKILKELDRLLRIQSGGKTSEDVGECDMQFSKDEIVNVSMKNGKIKKARYIGLFESVYACERTKKEIGRHVHHTVSLNNEEWHFPLGTVFKSKEN